MHENLEPHAIEIGRSTNSFRLKHYDLLVLLWYSYVVMKQTMTLSLRQSFRKVRSVFYFKLFSSRADFERPLERHFNFLKLSRQEKEVYTW